LVWNARASAGGEPAEQERVFEQWARPTALDHVQLSDSLSDVETSEWLNDSSGDQPRLVEGESGDWVGLTARAVASAGLRGELWTQPVELSFSPDSDAATRWSALVFGTELLDQLSEPEMMMLARRGGAVSPVTSYLAVEPGVRPSTEGLDWGGRGEGLGLGGIGTLGHGSHISRSPFDPQRYLEEQAKKQLTRCGAPERSLRLELETTRAELVDITRLELGGPQSFALEHCVREGLWALALPSGFNENSAMFRVSL
jgi:hypothetical protein